MKVLCALAADAARWRHGYELGVETGLKAGSLYPILVRLADRGLLEAAWEQSPPQGRPARHMYRLTPEGQELAASAAAPAVPVSAAVTARAARGQRGIPQPDGA
jgi:PadR family transcriptional regulator, regulatory protein PadR